MCLLLSVARCYPAVLYHRSRGSCRFFAGQACHIRQSSIVSAGSSATGPAAAEAAETAATTVVRLRHLPSPVPPDSPPPPPPIRFPRRKKIRPVLPVLTRKKRISRITPPPRRISVRLIWRRGLCSDDDTDDRLGKVRVTPASVAMIAGDLLHAKRDRGIVVTLVHRRNHGSADVADLGIVQDAFEAITYLDAVLPRIHHHNHRGRRDRFPSRRPPLVFQCGREFVDRLVIIQRLDGDDGNLGMGLAIDLSAQDFETVFRLGGQTRQQNR